MTSPEPRSPALKYATQGIRVNAVAPGFVETPMVMERGVMAGQSQETYRLLAAMHPMNRLAKPHEIGEVKARGQGRATWNEAPAAEGRRQRKEVRLFRASGSAGWCISAA